MTTLNPDITYIDQLKDFIQKHVSNRATTLIEKLKACKEDHSDALEGILYRDDWVTPATEGEGWEVLSNRNGWIFSNASKKLIYCLADDEATTEFAWCDVKHYQDHEPTSDEWRSLCENQGIDCYTEEPLEYWIVSDWLAIFLEKSGEIVSSDVYGLCIWGREGGALHMDNAIRQIYQDQIRG